MRATKIVRLISCLVPAVALALSACSDDPTSSGTGDANYIELSRTTTFQEAGRQFSISAFVRDERGNRLAQEIGATSSSAGIRVDSTVFEAATSETRLWITPLALDTTSYVVVTAGTLVDTLFVKSLPASLAINFANTIGSGATATPTVNALNSTGGVIATNVPYKVTSSDTTKLFVNPDGSITARGTGLATLTFTGPGGKITGTKDVTVVAGSFEGTVTPEGPAQGGTIVTITAPAGVTFDSDTKVVIGAATNFQMLISRDSTTLRALIPFGTPVGETNVSITNVGSQQLAFATSFEVTALATNEISEPANNSPSTAPTVTFPVDLVGLVSGDDQDDLYKITFAAPTLVSIKLEWDSSLNHDLDFLLLNSSGGYSTSACWAATSAIPETKNCTFPAGTFYLYVNNYEAYAGGTGVPVTYRLRVTPQ
jgi:hypothetical protein